MMEEWKDGTLRHTQGRGWERSIDDGPWTVDTGEGLGREILRCTQDRLSAIRAGRGKGGRMEGWKAEMSGPSIYMPYSFRILSVALGMPFCTRCQEPSWKTS
jgi:hypothetical protein